MHATPQMKSLLDTSDEASLLVRKDFTIAYANRTFRERYGYVAPEGRRCHELVFHEKRACEACGRRCPLLASLVSGVPERSQHKTLGPVGARYVETDVFPLMSGDGSLELFLERITEVRETSGLLGHAEVVSHSPAVQEVLTWTARFAVNDAPVLYIGESGTGKSVFARLLHENSRRAARPFAEIAARGLTSARFESELLGDEQEPGLIETASGGTLLIRNVDALDEGLQYALLGMLREKTFRPFGVARSRPLNLRILVTADEGLRETVRAKRFLSALYYELMPYSIRIPSLRDRLEDVDELAALFLSEAGGKAVWDSDALWELKAYEWPGNVRELGALVKRVSLYPSARQRIDAATVRAAMADLNAVMPPISANAGMLRQIESWTGSRKALAQRLGVSERTVYRLLQKHRDDSESGAKE